VVLRSWLLVASGCALWVAGCSSGLGERPALPAPVPGVISHEGGTPALNLEGNPRIAQGPTSTPAPWATPMLPTPLPKARAISHNLIGKSDCLYCHRGPTYYRTPADHATRTNQTCLGCHSPSSGPPPLVPHPRAGREACLVCHLTGKNGAHAVPGDHGGRLNDTCGTCHEFK
jgi:hypothetical protein